RDLCLFGECHQPKSFRLMAGTTGLEPATSAVTGQRSNQLSYVPKLHDQLGLNPLELTYCSGPFPEFQGSTCGAAGFSLRMRGARNRESRQQVEFIRIPRRRG